MTTYYNELDPYCAQWLRNLIDAGHITDGVVDERSIEDVRPTDLKGFTRCHFFAGLGGWDHALALAGYPADQEVWTGSCPCQPFSSASRGRGKGTKSDKHLWPVWRELIAAARPAVVLGEQVASAREWLDQVWGDMEGLDYSFRPVVLPAGAFGADHIRERLWFLGYSDRDGEPRLSVDAEAPRLSRSSREPSGVVPANGLPDDVACLRAFGNAIYPQAAAEFIKAATLNRARAK